VQIGESFEHGGYTITLTDVREVQGPNYISTMANFVDADATGAFRARCPEKRIYPAAGMPTTEAAIDYGFCATSIWCSATRRMAAAGRCAPISSPSPTGCGRAASDGAGRADLSLTDRRYRIAAGARKARAKGCRRNDARA
jgi:cytochrome c-type biogenesis protein CcmF